MIYKCLGLKIKFVILILFLSSSIANAACGVVWSASASWNGLNWGVGTTRYTVGFAVEYGGIEYTVKAIPGFNCAPNDATFGTTYWNTIGACGSPPTLTLTTGAGSITCSSATAGGTVATDGDGSGIKERGLVYNTSSSPTILNSKVIQGGTTTGLFANVAISGLTPVQTYYVRPYAINNNNLVGYGTEISFTTGALPTLAATTAATSIGASTAASGGNITAAGACSITERGLVYHTATLPTISNSKVIEGGTTSGTFTANLTGLTASTKYFVRAYATTAGGTSYGTETWFYTGTNPSITTEDNVINVFCESATFGFISGAAGRDSRSCCGTDALGNIISTVNEFGFIYGTSNADVTSSTVSSLVGSSIKTVNLKNTSAVLGTSIQVNSEVTDLTPNTTYYVKGYSTSSLGTTYFASNKSFTTSAACAVYYSCSTVNTWDTDATCATPVDVPTGTSVCYMRHNWGPSGGLTNAISEIAASTKMTARPYRLVIQSGGRVHVDPDATFVRGMQLLVNSNAQFCINGGFTFATDNGTSPSNIITRVVNSGSIVANGSLTNSLRITDLGEYCKSGTWTNQTTGNGSIGGDYSVNPTFSSTKYTNATCVGTFTIVPVTLTSFEGVNNGENTVIKWTTANEKDNDYFILEKSHDRINWIKSSEIKAVGNSNTTNHYSWVDNANFAGLCYYRLTQVDLDGKMEIFNIISVKKSKTTSLNEIIIYPNPSSDHFSLEYFAENEDEFTIMIESDNGQEVYHQSHVIVQGENIFHISSADFADGLYFVVIENTQGLKVTKKIIKD